MIIIFANNYIALIDYNGVGFDRSREVTVDHFQTIADRVIGPGELSIYALHYTNTFTDQSKDAATYH